MMVRCKSDAPCSRYLHNDVLGSVDGLSDDSYSLLAVVEIVLLNMFDLWCLYRITTPKIANPFKKVMINKAVLVVISCSSNQKSDENTNVSHRLMNKKAPTR